MSMTQPLSFTGQAAAADKRYDPQYDPLVAATPGAGRWSLPGQLDVPRFFETLKKP